MINMLKSMKNMLSVALASILFAILKTIMGYKQIVFCQLRSERIGHLVVNTELFLRRLKNGIISDENKIFIGVSSRPSSNRQLLKMYKRSFVIQESNLLYSLINTPKIKKSEFYYKLPFCIDEYHEFNNIDPVLSFTEQEERMGKVLLAKMGVGANDWFVCFHSRDAVYQNGMRCSKGGSWDYHNYRNSNIENYLKAAEYIAHLGGYAIRMGHRVEKALPRTRHPRIIDYAWDYRSDFGDIYLSAKCKFFIGNTAGIVGVPTCFNKPVAHANYFFQHGPLRREDIYIPKKLWSISKRRFLKFKEILELGIDRFMRTEQFMKAGIEVVENTEDEIFEMAKEINLVIDGQMKYSAEDERLHAKYRSLFVPDHRCYRSPGRIGIKFLSENMGLLT